MALIETVQLGKSFFRGQEQISALREVSLIIDAGEFVSITGPSGCGKSTLMYILGLIDRPSQGRYLLDGRDTAEIGDNEAAKLRNQKIGFVFQSFHLLPRATALRNVAMPLVYSASYDRSFTQAKCSARAAEALDRVGLADRVQHLPNELSGGQRQRVAIARALVNNPRIIFADEPTGNLDSKSGQEILNLFEALNDQGVTIVLVTHDPAIAKRTKRRIALFDGALKEDSRAPN